MLAILSTVGGLVGIGNHFEHFLSPVFGSEFPARIAEGSGTTELLLMGVSVLLAFAGAFLAYILYVSKPYLPQKIADSVGGFYEAVLHKYYVDEIYAAVFVKPLIDGSTSILWQGSRSEGDRRLHRQRGGRRARRFPTRCATCSPATCGHMRDGSPPAPRS